MERKIQDLQKSIKANLIFEQDEQKNEANLYRYDFNGFSCDTGIHIKILVYSSYVSIQIQYLNTTCKNFISSTYILISLKKNLAIMNLWLLMVDESI